MEYIRNNEELHKQGLYAELSAYKYQVFLDFREVEDNEWQQYAQLAQYLNGRGVPNIDEAMKEIFLQPIHQPFRELVNAGSLQWLIDNRLSSKTLEGSNMPSVLTEAGQKMRALLSEIMAMTGAVDNEAGMTADYRRELAALLAMPALEALFPLPKSPEYSEAIQFLLAGPALSKDQADGGLEGGEAVIWGPLLGWLFTHKLGKLLDQDNYSDQSRTWIDEWLLGKLIASGFKDLGLSETAAWRAVGMVKVLVGQSIWQCGGALEEDQAYQTLQSWLKNIDIQSFLGVNRYQGILWFNREAFYELLWWAFAAAVVEITAFRTRRGTGGGQS